MTATVDGPAATAVRLRGVVSMIAISPKVCSGSMATTTSSPGGARCVRHHAEHLVAASPAVKMTSPDAELASLPGIGEDGLQRHAGVSASGTAPGGMVHPSFGVSSPCRHGTGDRVGRPTVPVGQPQEGRAMRASLRLVLVALRGGHGVQWHDDDTSDDTVEETTVPTSAAPPSTLRHADDHRRRRAPGDERRDHRGRRGHRGDLRGHHPQSHRLRPPRHGRVRRRRRLRPGLCHGEDHAVHPRRPAAQGAGPSALLALDRARTTATSTATSPGGRSGSRVWPAPKGGRWRPRRRSRSRRSPPAGTPTSPTRSRRPVRLVRGRAVGAADQRCRSSTPTPARSPSWRAAPG